MKKFIYTALIILGLGFVLMLTGFILNGGKLNAISLRFNRDADYSKTTAADVADISAVEINLKARHIVFSLSEDNSYKVEYYESERDKIMVTVTDNVLKIKDNPPKYNFFFWGFRSRKVSTVTVVLPKDFTDEIAVDNNTGDVDLSELSLLTKLNVEVNTGDVMISGLTVNSHLEITSSTGNIEINGLTAPSLEIEVSTGRIYLTGVIISEVTSLKSSTGNIYISDMQSARLNVIASTGNLKIEDTITDSINAQTSTGSVTIKFYGVVEEYKLDLHTNTGRIRFQGEKCGNNLINPIGSKSITVSTSTGSISIDIYE